MSINLSKVKKKMSIYSKRRVRSMLSGNQGSVFKGRSIDFDDLRVYQYGDDVKDIDWKASARSKNPMIKRYVAIRKRNIMIVADSGRNMMALSPSGETKIDIASFAAGVVAYIADKNDDLVGMIFGNKTGNKRFPLKTGQSHIENFLNKYQKSVSLKSDNTDINAILNYISKNFRERMFLIIITDDFGAANLSPEILRRLQVRHEQMVVMIEDSSLTNPSIANAKAYDITKNLRLPSYIRKNRKLRQAEVKLRESMHQNTAHDLKRMGIFNCSIDSIDSTIPKLFKMLEERKHVRR